MRKSSAGVALLMVDRVCQDLLWGGVCARFLRTTIAVKPVQAIHLDPLLERHYGVYCRTSPL